MQVSVEELAMMIGQQRIEIYALQKQLAAMEAELLKLRPLPEKELDARPS